MITELFLNSCFILSLNKNALIQKNKALFRDIHNILSFYEKNEKTNIPITIKNKLECLMTICELKSEDKLVENIIDSILTGEKFKNLTDFLISKINEDYSVDLISDAISQVKTKKKLISLLSNYNELGDFLEVVKTGNYNSSDDLIGKYEGYVKTMYSGLMENNRTSDIDSASSLDILNGNYSKVVELMKKRHDRKNVLPTGFDALDTVLGGGFEKGRLYLFAGGSGSGKSTFCLNIIKNDLEREKTSIELENDDGIPQVHLYITLENSIDESLERLYMAMNGRNKIQLIRDLFSKDITDHAQFMKDKIVAKIKRTNTTFIIKHFKKRGISSTDLMMIMDDVIAEYGKDSIRCCYLDYMDLLKTDVFFKEEWLKLSYITAELKNVADEYKVPLISPTQLGREIYRGNLESKDLNMGMMGGAIHKVNESDFVAVMTKDKTEDTVHMNIGKQRNGISNVSLDFKIDFSIFKFLNGYASVSRTKTDDELVNPDGTTSFGGFGAVEKKEINNLDIALKNTYGDPKNVAF